MSTGTVKGGVVVLDDPMQFPEGTKVEVMEKVRSGPNSLAKALLSIAGTCEGLPEDLAENHDHYLHGLPKR